MVSKMSNKERLEINNVKRLISDKEVWEMFKFFEHQLGVLDSKASTLLTLYSVVLSILLAIILFINVQSILLATFMILGLICVLLSAVACSFITWTVWATRLVKDKDLTGLVRLRNLKTGFLKVSIILFLLGLTLTLVAVAIQILSII